MRTHIWDMKRDACLACSRSRQEIVEHEIECDGGLKYRDWLRGTTFVCEAVIPRCWP